MALLEISLHVRDIADGAPFSAALQAMAGGGSMLPWIPAEVLQRAGVRRRKSTRVRTEGGALERRDVGSAIIAADGFEANDEVVFGEPGDAVLLGERTLSGFGASIDHVAGGLVPRPLLVAANLL